MVILACLISEAIAVRPFENLRAVLSRVEGRLRPDATYGGAHLTVSAQPRVLRWAGDPEGGAPFVEADPEHPDRLVGFDVDIVTLLASGAGRTPEFVNARFESISPALLAEY